MADDERVRYQRAAEAALQQLDWCVMYLRGVRKPEVARAVSRNRDRIRQRLSERSGSEHDRER